MYNCHVLRCNLTLLVPRIYADSEGLNASKQLQRKFCCSNAQLGKWLMLGQVVLLLLLLTAELSWGFLIKIDGKAKEAKADLAA